MLEFKDFYQDRMMTVRISKLFYKHNERHVIVSISSYNSLIKKKQFITFDVPSLKVTKDDGFAKSEVEFFTFFIKGYKDLIFKKAEIF